MFYAYMTGRETLELSAAMHGLDVTATMARIAPLVARLRLAEDLNGFAEDYSRGMKKKLGLLLALLHQPLLLVLDEPTNGLDVESMHLFHALMEELAAQGTTILFSTHLMDQVARLCSHVVVIGNGRLIAKGPLAALQAEHAAADLETLFLQLTHRPEAA
jgi:ABC-type multidrug transport system ATPase subunit